MERPVTTGSEDNKLQAGELVRNGVGGTYYMTDNRGEFDEKGKMTKFMGVVVEEVEQIADVSVL